MSALTILRENLASDVTKDDKDKHNWVVNAKKYFRLTYRVSHKAHKKRPSRKLNSYSSHYEQSLSQQLLWLASYNIKYYREMSIFNVALDDFVEISEDEFGDLLQEEFPDSTFKTIAKSN